MKKFTSLMLMLLCAVTAWAFTPGENITDMSLLSEGDYVLIKNVGRGMYAYENPGNRWIGNGAEATDLTYAWQVHIEADGKYSFSSVMGYYIPTPLDGKAMYTVEATDETKDEFTFTAHHEDNSKWLVKSTNAEIYWDGQAAQFVGWQGNGANSRFEIIPLEVTVDEINAYINAYYTTIVENARNAAITEVELLATESLIFPAATEVVASINAVPFTGTTETEANATVEEINALVAAYKTNAYKALNGKYFTLFTPGRTGYAKMTENGTGNAGSADAPEFLWQFVENNGSVNIYNPYIGKYLIMDGTNAMRVTANAAEAGAFEITIASEPSNATAKVGFKSNGWYIHLNGSLLGWYSGGASEWAVAEVTDFTAVFNVPAAKTAAIAEVELLATATTIYPATTETVNAINAVTPAGTGFAELNAAVEEINAIVATYKTNAYKALAGKNFYIHTPARGGVYLEVVGTSINGKASMASPNDIWQFVEKDGKVNIYNPFTGLYFVEPGDNSTAIGLTADAASAGAYELLVSATDNDEDGAVTKLTCNGKSVHVASGLNLVRWDNGGSSEFNINEITDYTAIATGYKTTLAANADGLAFACNDEQIATVKAAINGVTTNSYAVFAEIDAAYANAAKGLGIENKYFTFQATSTDTHRNLVWAAAGAAGKAIGAHDYCDEAVWQAIPATTGLYIKNVRYSSYMGAPSSNCPLTEEPAVEYTFELVDAVNKVFELHTNGETLHASNHTDDKLLSWDGNEAASRWTVLETEAVTPLVTIRKEWKKTDNWGTAIAVAEYPAVAVNEGAGSNPVNVREFEITTDGAKVMDITFAYSGGSCALNVLGVEVVDAGGYVVAGDYKSGKTGTGTTCSYQVKVAEAGTYTLRYYVWSDGSNRLDATNGTITVVIDGVETTEFTHDVTFAAKYATMYLGYRAAIPAGVEAYVVESAEGGYVDLVKVEGALPSNTAVVLKKVGEETTYTFNYTDAAEAEVVNNLLDGTIADKHVAVDAYVLANGVKGVGFYKATLNQVENTAFKNNANKAYLVVENASPASLSFRFPGTTGVEEITDNRVQSTVIYDLTGRRVEAITAPGIYIVNGVKRVVR